MEFSSFLLGNTIPKTIYVLVHIKLVSLVTIEIKREREREWKTNSVIKKQSQAAR